MKTTEKDIFNNKLDILINASKNISHLVEDKDMQDEINNIIKKAEENSLYIGVTGVIKSGKSTLLNALLSKDILGTSIVPETANLTIIKHSNKETAKVFFWNEKEWDEIVESAKNDEALSEWLENTTNNIEDTSLYIKNERVVKEIEVDDLPKYTSAKKKHGSLCNLVKYVELYSSLKYLEHGVNIVDTPGIDDPVIRREQITQEFINKCDVMVHAMNASQAFTKKDADFIINNILGKDIYKLILVITRKDNVTADELSTVISHVKESITTKFNEYRDGNDAIKNKINNILDKIEIVAVSGKDALNHRIGKSNKARLSIDESGIEYFENKLDTLLFKDNPKNAILLTQSKPKLIDISNRYINVLNFEESNKYKSTEEAKSELDRLIDEKKQYKDNSQHLLEKINNKSHSFNEFLNDIYKKSIDKIETISDEVSRKVNDYIWEYLDDKKKPDEEKIKEIIETTIKSKLLDSSIMYEESVKHEFKFHLKNILTDHQVCLDGDQLTTSIDMSDFNFDRLIGDMNFYTLATSVGIGVTILPGLVTVMSGPIAWVGVGLATLLLVNHERKSNLLQDKRRQQINDIDRKLKENLSDLFEKITNDMGKQLQEANKNILEKFNQLASQPYHQRIDDLERIENSLRKQIEDNNNKEEDLESYRKHIKQKHDELQKNISMIKDL